MKALKLLIFLCLAIPVLAQDIPIDINSVSDQQLVQIIAKYQLQGLSPDEIGMILKEKGLPDDQITGLKRRIAEIDPSFVKPEIENKSNNIYGKYNLVKLGSICDKPQYGANESAIDGNPLTDYRYIRITDINDNGELNSEWRTAANIEEKYILKEGDFLFARSGATVGKTFLYKNKYGKALYAGYLIRFRTNKDKLLPDFLKLVTQSSFYKKWVADTQTGTSQPNINGQMYSDLQIPLPPLSIQEKLVLEVEKLEQVITNNQKIIDESSTLKQQVMKKYL